MPNLRLTALTDGRYRISLEESFHHERPEVRTPDRIWYKQISCQSGAFISIYSLEPFILHLFTPRVKNARTIWEAIKGIPGARADFHFDGEAELYFPLEAVHAVAHLAGAKRRRHLSEAQKEAMALGREKAGLGRDEKGRIVHCQAQKMTQDKATWRLCGV